MAATSSIPSVIELLRSGLIRKGGLRKTLKPSWVRISAQVEVVRLRGSAWHGGDTLVPAAMVTPGVWAVKDARRRERKSRTDRQTNNLGRAARAPSGHARPTAFPITPPASSGAAPPVPAT